MADLADYLNLTVSQAREQFQALRACRPVPEGRQVRFLPTETLLCLAASFLVNHRHYGGSTAQGWLFCLLARPARRGRRSGNLRGD